MTKFVGQEKELNSSAKQAKPKQKQKQNRSE